MLILTQEERRALIRVIENLFIDEEGLYKIIMDAYLENQFLPEEKFRNPHCATMDLIEKLEFYGDLPGRPDYHALGALLSSLLEVRPLSHSEACFFAWLILRYPLVHDVDFVEKLRAHYGFSERLPTSDTLIIGLPSYSPRSPFIGPENLVTRSARRYAILDIRLFAHQGSEYQVQLNFIRPGDTSGHIPISGKATFNVREFLAATSYPLDYGEHLTRSLFQDRDIQQGFRDMYTATEASDLDLRLRLFIDKRANELHALRWETLFHPLKMDSPLLTSEHLLFSRFLGTDDFSQEISSFNAPHKALLAIANPTNITGYGIGKQPFAAIPVQDELDRAAKYLSAIPWGTLVSNPSSPGQVTLANLFARLREGYTILYLICHGAIHTKQGSSPILYLELADGSADIVPVKELIRQVEQMSQCPQLVVLGSCQSVGNGMYGPDGDNMLTTLGPELVFAGVPSVVGMQGEISMDTLAGFMPTFFKEWERDGQLDRAIAVARSTVIQRNDWWMPVLFTRLLNGRL